MICPETAGTVPYDVPRMQQKETGRLLSAGSTAQTKDTTKKRFHLVIGESALLIADYFEWVDKVLISR